MTTIPELAETMQTLLTKTADEIAQKTKFIERRRKVSGAGFAQTMVFSFLGNPRSTREEVRQTAATIGLRVSTPGLDKRFTAKAAYFLDSLLQQALGQMVEAIPGSAGLLARFAGLYIADTTMVGLPAALATVWKGNNHDEEAAVKVAVRWELSRGSLGLWLRNGRTHDQQTGVGSAPLPQGSVRLNDLGFFNLDTFAQDLRTGVDFFSRYKTGTILATPDGTRLDVAAYLNEQKAGPVDIFLLLGAEHLPARLIAWPMPQEVADQRRARLLAQARHKQQAVSQTTLTLAAWTIFVTSLSPDRLSPRDALILGMTRWQIECLFDRWKNEGALDESRSQDPHRVWCEFYAKLLALLVQHWLFLVSCWQRLDRSLHRAAQLIRKHAFHLALTLPLLSPFIQALSALARTLLFSSGLSRRRSHPLTFQYWLLEVDWV